MTDKIKMPCKYVTEEYDRGRCGEIMKGRDTLWCSNCLQKLKKKTMTEKIDRNFMEKYRIFAIEKGQPISFGFDWEEGRIMFGHCPLSPSFKDKMVIGSNLHFVKGTEITKEIKELYEKADEK